MATPNGLVPLPWFVRLTAVQRLAPAVVVASAAFLLQPSWLSPQTHLLVTWNLGAWVYLILAGMVIARADAAMTQTRTRTQDQSGYIIFLLVGGAAMASFVAIGFLMGGIKDLSLGAFKQTTPKSHRILNNSIANKPLGGFRLPNFGSCSRVFCWEAPSPSICSASMALLNAPSIGRRFASIPLLPALQRRSTPIHDQRILITRPYEHLQRRDHFYGTFVSFV